VGFAEARPIDVQTSSLVILLWCYHYTKDTLCPCVCACVRAYEREVTGSYLTRVKTLSFWESLDLGCYNRQPTDTAGYGFQIQCSNCTETGWYGILLYLFLEIVPITIFYFAVILVFKLTSPLLQWPVTSCTAVDSTLVELCVGGGDLNVSRRMFILNHQSEFFRKLILSLYDLWNLRFFYFLMPSICISSKLKPLHFALLGYFSIFYPIVLIFLTWILIKLHDRNFKPLVWLWRLMHRCFIRLRRGWNKTSDIVDIFSTFFLLSFSNCKSLYQIASSVLLLPIQSFITPRLSVVLF
jgi:hypothetical protein